MEIQFRHSIALVKDIKESRHFYEDIIGLKVIKDYDTIIQFQDNFIIHTADLFYEYIKKPYHGENMGHDNVDFYFTTDDLSGVQEKFKKAKVTFIHEIRQHDWGEKVIRVYDPDGHILEFGDNHAQ